MLLVKIWQLFGSFKFCQNKTRNNAWRLRREKRNLTINNKGFQSPKNRTFSKGLIHAFGQKMTSFSLLKFDQNKTRNNAF